MKFALRRLQLLVVPVAWLVALSCVAGVAATLFWRLAAPPAIDRPVIQDSDPRAAARRIASQRPFAGQAAPSAAPLAVATTSAFSLVGVATGFVGGPGFALLKSGTAEPEAFVEGEEIASGVRLRRILADGVEIERGGRLEHIALPSATTAGVVPAALDNARHIEAPPNASAASDRDAASDNASETPILPPAESDAAGPTPKDN